MSNKKPRHLNWYLIAFLFALYGVTQANISTGTSTVGVQKGGHNTEQTTFATLGGGAVTKKNGEQHDLANVNRDLNETQIVTLDQQTAGLDATVTVDHRLLTKKGQGQIKEDFTKTGMIVDTVALIATTDRVGITDFFKETGKKHTTYEGIKSEIANNPDLAKQLQNPDLTPDQKEAMLDQLTHRVMVDLGYSKEGYQNIIVANDKDYVQKEDGIYQRQGFYSEETQNAYINDAFIKDTKGLVTTAGHELSHAMDDRSDNTYSQKDNETYANQFGNNFGNYTNTALGVTGNGSMANSNSHVGNNSSTVQTQTTAYNALDKNKGDDLLHFIPPLIAAGAMIVSDIKVANAPAPGENLDEIPQSVSLLPTDLAAEALNELTEHKYEMAIGIAAAVGNPKRALEDGADAVKAVSGKLGRKDGIGANNETMPNITKKDSNDTLLLENKYPDSKPPEHPGYPITAGPATEGTKGWMVVESGQIDPITGQVNRPGSFLSEKPVISVDQARNELAIRNDWKKNPSHVQEYEIVPGTQVQRSTVGSQTNPGGQILSGGGSQIEILMTNSKDRNSVLIPIGKAEPIK